MSGQNQNGITSDSSDASTGYLYDPKLLTEITLEQLPTKISFDPAISISNPGPGLRIRPLNQDDFDKGFPAILAGLTQVGDVSKEMFLETFSKMKNSPNMYYVTVIEDTNTGAVIGSATLLLEQKFIHNCAKRARIEDVVVSDEYRGKQLGKLLITVLTVLAKHLGCYKISLDCRDKMISFYETFGYSKEPGNGNFMCVRF